MKILIIKLCLITGLSLTGCAATQVTDRIKEANQITQEAEHQLTKLEKLLQGTYQGLLDAAEEEDAKAPDVMGESAVERLERAWQPVWQALKAARRALNQARTAIQIGQSATELGDRIKDLERTFNDAAKSSKSQDK